MSVLAADVAPRTVVHHGAVLDLPPVQGERLRPRLQAAHVLVTVAVLAAWTLLHLLVLSGVEQGRAQVGLYDQLRSDLAEGTVPVGAGAQPGDPLALLSVPAIGLDRVVAVEGARPAQLQDGPGHVPGSVLPGQQGVSVLAGRSLTHGAPFADLTSLRTGHLVEVTTQQGDFIYTVTGLRREGDPVPGKLAEGAGRLVLVTAGREGSSGLASLRAGEILYVDAELAEGAVAPGPVSTTDPAARWMDAGVSTTDATQVVLALQVLALVLAGTFWCRRRFGTGATAVVALPCLVAAAWLTSSLAARLLPGLV
ncbi:sortase [Nocardioides yefusunii]|uniref:Sortase n=1 Tax=Nocardioides yefusunii TaxID=2500546 RepID=A0ABW1R0C8_9ACTN|nr:sortase [Nocardioides yefusunii]